jgi:methionyl-tRNA formyltransferase
VPPLRALLDSHHRVVGVLTQPDRPKGRGQQLTRSSVKVLAEERGLPIAQPQKLRSAPDTQQLAAWQPDLMVVVAYGLILPPAVLHLPRLGCLNIHASLLPRWRGAAPVQRAILAGDAQTGITIMRMDAGLDRGPIVLQRTTAIGSEDFTGSLQDRLAALGAQALLQALEQIGPFGVRSTPQAEDGITYAAKLDKREALIRWEDTAIAIERQIRAFNPWPVAETHLEGQQLRIFAARAREGASNQLPGTIVDTSRGPIVVSCGSGSLELHEVQRAGRRRMAVQEFSHSTPLLGKRLG